MTRHTVPTRLALVLAVLLTMAACSGGGEEEAVETDRASASDDEPADSTDTTGAEETGTEADSDGDANPRGDTTVDNTNAHAGVDEATSTTAGQPPATDGAGAGSTGQTGGSDDEETTAAPARPIVPRPGTYTYQRTTTTDEGSETETSDAVVERLSGDDSAGRTRFTIESEQGTITSEANVDDSGSLVERSVIGSPLGEIDCDWEPDWLLNGPFAQGSTWTVETACSDSGTGFEVEVSMTGSGAVVGYEQIEVNGTAVTAWVTETTMVTEFTVSSATINGTQRTESTSRSWIDPAMGMQVREESHNENSGDFRSGSSDVVTEFARFAAA